MRVTRKGPFTTSQETPGVLIGSCAEGIHEIEASMRCIVATTGSPEMAVTLAYETPWGEALSNIGLNESLGLDGVGFNFGSAKAIIKEGTPLTFKTQLTGIPAGQTPEYEIYFNIIEPLDR